jgi:hypothetical protein
MFLFVAAQDPYFLHSGREQPIDNKEAEGTRTSSYKNAFVFQ